MMPPFQPPLRDHDLRPREGPLAEECAPSHSTEGDGGTKAVGVGAANPSHALPTGANGVAPLASALVGKRAAIYLRVSTDAQEDGKSLDGQLEECRAYCDRMGYRVCRIVREVGSRMDPGRPGLLMLLDYAMRGSFAVLVVWNRDRFGADPGWNTLFERDLHAAGVVVESIRTGQQDANEETELMNGMADLINRYEVRKTARRCTMGRREAARQGEWPTRAPYGFTKLEGRLVPHPAEAPLIREAYAECLRGANGIRLSLLLGVHKTTAFSRLQNPAYKGQAVYAGISVPCPALVSPETWQEAVDAIAARYANKGQPGALPFSRRGP